MNAHQESERIKGVSRREMFAASAVSAMFGLVAVPGEARAVSGGPISPGYFGPQFYGQEEEAALLNVVETGTPFRFQGGGPTPDKVVGFEEAFAKYMGTKYALGVTSGTAALDCAVAALEIGPGDEVIVPAYTWWSDYTCVVHAGALPVFADIDETYNLDPADFARKITPRTKAVITVHLLGGLCDIDPILETAKKHGIRVIEDCAQCVGGSHRGRKVGSMGDIGIYSFQVNKMISSGEGGAVVTSDPVLYERAARFHHMGLSHAIFLDRVGGESKVPTFAGENFRMSEFTGAVLGAQLPKLDTIIAGLRQSAGAVCDGIKDLPGLRQRRRPDPDGDLGVNVGLVMESKARRDACVATLKKAGVPGNNLSGSVLLPIEESIMAKRTRHANWPTFNSPEGKAVQYGPQCCAQTLDVYDRAVQVRMGPKYTQEDTDRIVAAIREFFLATA